MGPDVVTGTDVDADARAVVVRVAADAGAVVVAVVAVAAEPAIEIAGGAEIKTEKSSSKPEEDCVVTCERGNAAVDGGVGVGWDVLDNDAAHGSVALRGRISGTEGGVSPPS